MTERLWFLIPELLVLAGAVSCAILGVSRSVTVRRSLPIVAFITLVLAFIASNYVYSPASMEAAIGPGAVPLPWLGRTVIPLVVIVGILLVMVQAGLIDRSYEGEIAAGDTRFNPLRTSRGEYYAFFLLSLCGLMLTAAAPELDVCSATPMLL